MKLHHTRVLLATVASMALSAPAFAQAAAETTDPNDIVVTAQNRTENLQNVPIAISVISAEKLQAQGVTDFTSVQRVSPALNITNDTNNTRVTVRGVGTLSNSEGQDQSIAVNIDGEYINRPTVLNMAIFDIQRVEVLRGPQGTLYGRNSTGGAVNFVTRKPGDRFAFNASATYGNYNQVIIDGGVDIPLGDVGGLRVAGFYRSHDGYNLHLNPAVSPSAAYVPYKGNRSDSDDTGGGRVSLRLKPVSNLTIEAAAEYVAQTLVPAAQAWADLNAAANNPGSNPAVCGNGWASAGLVNGAPACIPQNTNILPTVDRHTYNSPDLGIGYLHQTSTAVRGRIAWDFGPATLTYTGGYRFTKDTNVLTLSPAYAFTHFGETVKTQSHELRLNGETGGIKWQGGVFYFREKQGTNGGLWAPGLFGPGFYVNYFQHPTDTKSVSGFAQVEVPLTPTLTAIGGGRYTHDVRDGVWTNYSNAIGLGAVGIGPVDLTQANFVSPYCTGALDNPFHAPAFLFCQSPNLTPLHYSSSKFTWMAGLNYQPSAALLIYGKVSTGYKAGGFDGTATVFRPERNTAYEAGAKYKFGPNTVNVAGFYYDYKDLQNEVLLNPKLSAQTFNAGKAKIYGAELEATLRPTPDDTITASVNWLHAKYGEFLASVNYYNEPGNTAPTINLAGRRLPQTPRWVLTLGYDHVFQLGSAGTLTASAFTRYKGDYYLDFYNYNDSHQKAHTQTDLSLEYKPESKRFGVQAYVRNLEDYRSLAHAQNIVVPGQANIYNWQFSPPRTYGVRLSVDF